MSVCRMTATPWSCPRIRSPWEADGRSSASPGSVPDAMGEDQHAALTDVRALARAHALALDFVASLPERPVGARADAVSVMATLGGPLPDAGEDALAVVERLA